jgi:hypothetical protein
LTAASSVPLDDRLLGLTIVCSSDYIIRRTCHQTTGFEAATTAVYFHALSSPCSHSTIGSLGELRWSGSVSGKVGGRIVSSVNGVVAAAAASSSNSNRSLYILIARTSPFKCKRISTLLIPLCVIPLNNPYSNLEFDGLKTF